MVFIFTEDVAFADLTRLKIRHVTYFADFQQRAIIRVARLSLLIYLLRPVISVKRKKHTFVPGDYLEKVSFPERRKHCRD